MEQFVGFVEQAWALNWVRALVIVLGAIVLAKITEFIFTRVLTRLTHFTDTDLDDKIIALLRRPVFVTVVGLGLYTAISVLDLRPVVGGTLRSIIHTVLILVWVVSGIRFVSTLLDGLSRLADRVTWIEARTVPLFDNLAKLLLFGGAMYLLLVAWDLNVAPWLASAGVAGIAIGFAAKDSLANLFGGIFVIMDSPYQIGDYINLDSGERGKVTKIGLRSTRVLTRNDVEITIPNAIIANSTIVNESGGPSVRFRTSINVGVAYGSDIDKVREVLMAAAVSVPEVVDDPEPRIRFIEMGDSALIYKIQCWIAEPSDRGRAVDGLNTAVYKALGAAGISIPFPQRDVHLFQSGS